MNLSSLQRNLTDLLRVNKRYLSDGRYRSDLRTRLRPAAPSGEVNARGAISQLEFDRSPEGARPYRELAETSLALAGATNTDRETVLKAHLRSLSRAYAAWRGDPASVAPLYRRLCRTLGREVRVDLPGGEAVEGTAVDVDDRGCLVVRDANGAEHVFAAGDVVHLR